MKIAALAVLLAAAPALAEPTIRLVPTCVAGDVSEAERRLLVRALERIEQLIVETGCEETITLSHEGDGGSVRVRLANSHAQHEVTVSPDADMRDIYRRLATALLEPAPAPLAAPPAVTVYEPAPARLEPGTWYALIGVGIHDGDSGKGFALGYRYGNRWKLDLALSVASSDTSTTTAVRVQALYLETPAKTRSLYYGTGLSYASTEVEMSTGVRDASGARIESTLGVELARTRGGGRLYVEGNLSIPLYDVASDYPVAFVASFGAGL